MGKYAIFLKSFGKDCTLLIKGQFKNYIISNKGTIIIFTLSDKIRMIQILFFRLFVSFEGQITQKTMYEISGFLKSLRFFKDV